MADNAPAPIERVLSLQLWSLRDLGDIDAQLDAAVSAGLVLVEPSVDLNTKEADTLP